MNKPDDTSFPYSTIRRITQSGAILPEAREATRRAGFRASPTEFCKIE